MDEKMRTVIQSDEAPKAIGPYSQAIMAGDFLYTSGQVALSPKTGKLIEGGIKEQTAQVMKNLEAILRAGETQFGDVVKVNVFLSDINDFTVFNQSYQTYFNSDPPARSAYQVAALPLGALVEVEMIAYVQ
jgi:2-iminobutanoate/2-iminopropanoate deaminase